MAKKKTKKQGIKARKIWHLYPFNIRRVGSDGKPYFAEPRFFLIYLDDNFPDNEFGTMQRPRQDEINAVIDATNRDGGTLDIRKVKAFLRQRCTIHDVEPMQWGDIVAEIAEYQKGKQGEYSKPLGLKDWAAVFDVGRNKMREMINGGDYGFVKVGINGRKWKLLKADIPAEYLEKYRIYTGR